ncbi:GNAT family N-acetyltransferase [Aquimarina muelleri]|uniref:GNAT family N-acetyltransferase n=1 Tax=Aquimarina muelleri TaxID=279356 RepID=UPI003F6831AE
MEKLKLVKAEESDKNFLIRLRKVTMVEHLEKAGIYLSEEQHISRINFNYESTYLIYTSNQKVGMLKYLEIENTIEILQLQILPDYQGLGIGKSIINQLINASKISNKTLTLKVLKENPARHLYQRIGFGIVDEDTYEFFMQLLLK